MDGKWTVDVAPAGTGSGGEPSAVDFVADAVQRLDTVAVLPLEQRPDAFGGIHEQLRSALAEIDDA